MRRYKMGRGNYFDDLDEDLATITERYWGDIDGTREEDGVEMFVVEDTMVFDEVLVGREHNDGKKDRLVVHFEEKDVATLQEEGLLDAADDAMDAKNRFLEEVTGRDAKARRDSMKRDVEDDPDADVDV
jgi:hypothetical protein